jgi:hypothetical protein
MRQRFNKWERKENRAKELAKNMHGEGLYLYENVNNADLTLPRPTKGGVRKVGPKGRFQGDNYYMQMVRSHDLRLIEILQTPEAEREANMKEQKLILDQPDRVTNEGTIEQVVAPGKAKLHKLNDATEEKEKQKQPEVLITEDPMSGVEIILE